MIKYSFFFLLVFNFSLGFGQSDKPEENKIDSDFLPSSFYTLNRKTIRDSLPENSVAVFFSAPIRNRSNEVDFPFHQNPNFYYLTGINEPNAVLLIFKSPFEFSGKISDEILFIPQADEYDKRWTGNNTSISEAIKKSGIRDIYHSCEFTLLKMDSSSFNRIYYLSLPEGIQRMKKDLCDLYELVETFKQKISFPSANCDSYLADKLLGELRKVKKPEEITLMRKAITISVEAHKEMMRVLKAGMTEYQVQAVGEYVFKKNGAEDIGYPSICGGGENSCVLHYDKNRRQLNDGDLILLDMGAEYHGYSADVTRTLPVNGKFSEEQKLIYNLVLKAQKAAFLQCKPGNDFRDPHLAAVQIIKEGLLELGIISEEKDYYDYFMHGTSHYLGLEVHDQGIKEKLTPGNVITVEPGIYISPGSNCDPKWWNIGIRIEDDVLITETGYENLSSACPSEINEIEKMMLEKAQFIKN